MSAPCNDGGKDTASVYAWMTRDSRGVEQIMAIKFEDTVMPLISTDASLSEFEEYARSAGSTDPVELVRFTRAETVIPDRELPADVQARDREAVDIPPEELKWVGAAPLPGQVGAGDQLGSVVLALRRAYFAEKPGGIQVIIALHDTNAKVSTFWADGYDDDPMLLIQRCMAAAEKVADQIPGVEVKFMTIGGDGMMN